MAKLTADQIQEIVRRYQVSQSAETIAQTIGCSRQTVLNILSAEGIEIRDRGLSTAMGKGRDAEDYLAARKGTHDFTEEEEKAFAVAAYLDGQSATSIGKELGRPTITISHWLKAAGIETRTLSEARRTVHFNEQAFDRIETDAQAYWLGFLAADGGISDRGDIRLNLQTRDKEHLEKLREFLELPTPVKIIEQTGGYSKTGACYLDMCSRKLCAGLARYGVGPRKTLALQWPSILPDALHGAYVRGLFDGDGTWGALSRSGIAQWGIAGNRSFLLDLQQVMMAALNLNQTKLTAHHTTAEIAYLRYSGTKQLLNIAIWMYRDAAIYLPRKYSSFREYLQNFHPNHARDFVAQVLLT